MMNLHPRTVALLARAGLAEEELAALGAPPRHRMPNEPRGFGLLGTTGTGKTWALAQHFGQILDRTVRRQPNPDEASLAWLDGAVMRDARLLWVSWLAQAERIRRRRFERTWVEGWASAAEEVTFLVLDDLGREQRDAANDPAQEVLQRVLESRHRHRMTLHWTSNRTREELTAFYGGPFVSRLLGAWPDYPLEGQDMRLFGVPELKKAGGDV